jgi:hypothetical protein
MAELRVCAYNRRTGYVCAPGDLCCFMYEHIFGGGVVLFRGQGSAKLNDVFFKRGKNLPRVFRFFKEFARNGLFKIEQGFRFQPVNKYAPLKICLH